MTTQTDRIAAKIIAAGPVVAELSDRVNAAERAFIACAEATGLGYARGHRSGEPIFTADVERVVDVIGRMRQAERNLDEFRTRIGELEDALDPHGDGCCALHGDAPHGKEAEELRAGIEALMQSADRGNWWSLELQKLLDRVSARDSLAHVRANDALAEAERELGEERLRAEIERSKVRGLHAALRRISRQPPRRCGFTTSRGVVVGNFSARGERAQAMEQGS